MGGRTQQGAAHYDGQHWTNYIPQDGLADAPVWSVGVTPNGAVWFSTHGGGVSRYDPATNSWRTFGADDGLPLPNGRYLTVEPGATGDAGAWVHIGYDRVYRFQAQPGLSGKDSPLAGATINTLAVAADGAVWVGTERVRLERASVPGSVWRTSFVVHIDVGTGLTPREQAILYNSARTCEVHKLLTGEVSFDYRWIQAANTAQEM